MNIQKQKKEREKYILIEFISELKLPVISIEASETPDFYLKTMLLNNTKKEKLISIELTKIINPNLKKREAIGNKIIELAKDEFLKLFPKIKLVVFVYFENYFLSEKKKKLKKLLINYLNL
jgi:hypothetical protein